MVPTFSSGPTLERALRSVLNQSMREIEVIASSHVEARALADQLGALPRVRVRVR